jgi:hypothetical protein
MVSDEDYIQGFRDFQVWVEYFYKLIIILFVKYYINPPFNMHALDKVHIDRNWRAGLQSN